MHVFFSYLLVSRETRTIQIMMTMKMMMKVVTAAAVAANKQKKDQ
jgi:hypothetical protein